MFDMLQMRTELVCANLKKYAVVQNVVIFFANTRDKMSLIFYCDMKLVWIREAHTY
jgi:hypothetical protein